MPSRYSSEDLLTRETRLLYFIGKKGKYIGTISEISRSLGYEDDSTINRKINDLIDRKLVEEVQYKNGRGYKLTKKGFNKIRFLLLPKLVLFFLLSQSLALIYISILGLIGFSKITPEIILGYGLLSIFTTIYLLDIFNKGEKEIWLENPSSAKLTDESV